MAKILQVKSKTTDFENGRVSLELKETRFVTKSKLLVSVPGQTLENVAAGQKVGEELIKDINDKQFALKRRCDTLSDRYNTLLKQKNKTPFSFTFRNLTNAYFNSFKVGATIDTSMMKKIVNAEKELEEYKNKLNSSYQVFLKETARDNVYNFLHHEELSDTLSTISVDVKSLKFSLFEEFRNFSSSISNNINGISLRKTGIVVSGTLSGTGFELVNNTTNGRQCKAGTTRVTWRGVSFGSETGEVNVSGSFDVVFTDLPDTGYTNYVPGVTRKVCKIEIKNQKTTNCNPDLNGFLATVTRRGTSEYYTNPNPTLPWLKQLEFISELV